MGNLFIDILEVTLPVSVLIAVLLLFSPVIKRAYVSKWRYYMWLFVALRLLLPFSPKFKTHMTMEIPSQVTAVAANTAKNSISALQVLTLLWAAGIVFFAAYRIFCYLKFKRLVKRWQSDIADTEVMDEFQAAKDFAKVKRNVAIKRCKAVSSPMIFGVIKPVLLMPGIEFTSEELSVILRHELVHLKRCDILYKLLLMVVCTVYWFNPMVYLMAKAANKDLELACDAEVVKDKNAQYRRGYCEVIMRLAHSRRGAKTALSTCFCFSKKTVMERFKYILDEKIKRNGIIMFLVVAVSVAVSGGMVSFATERVAEEIEDNIEILERPVDAPKATAEPEAPEPQKEIDSKGDNANQSSFDNSYNYQSYTEYDTPYADAEEADGGDIESAAEESVSGTVGEVTIGEERGSVYDTIGEPDSVSSDGSRETYNLPDGNTAVLQYDGEVLDSGYIVVN